MEIGARLVQLVRAHYRRDDQGFTTSAVALARVLKAGSLKQQIFDLIKGGYPPPPAPVRQAAPASGARRSAASVPTPARPAMTAPPSPLLHVLPVVDFADLLLDPALEAFVSEIGVEYEYREELAARKHRPRSRLLFFGPPGNGKSSVAAAMAKQLGVTAFGVNLSEMQSMYVSELGKHVAELFRVMRNDMLIVFDELDAIAATRGGSSSSLGKEQNAAVNTMLTEMDRNKAGLFVATTNRLDVIDPAIIRRFDEVIAFPEPSPEQLQALRDRLCAGYDIEPVSIEGCANFDNVTKACEREARRIAMREILAADGVAVDDEDDARADGEALN